MRIHTLFIATHLAAGLAGVLAVALANWFGGEPLQYGILLTVAAVPVVGLAFWLTTPMLRTLGIANEPSPPVTPLTHRPWAFRSWMQLSTAFAASYSGGPKRPPTRVNNREIWTSCSST